MYYINFIIYYIILGDTNQEFCDYGPTSSPDVINVGATQQAVDHRYPGMINKEIIIMIHTCILTLLLHGYRY